MNRREFLALAAFATVPGAVRAAVADPAGLIFIAQSSCPYCQTLAPLLHDLSLRGLPVLPVSMDRAPIAPFVDFEDGLLHPISTSVTSVPLVLVYHRRLDRITHEVAGFRDLRHYIRRLSRALDEARSL